MSVEHRELELLIERFSAEIRAELIRHSRILEEMDRRHSQAAKDLAAALDSSDGENRNITRYHVGLFTAGVLVAIAVLQFLGMIRP